MPRTGWVAFALGLAACGDDAGPERESRDAGTDVARSDAGPGEAGGREDLDASRPTPEAASSGGAGAVPPDAATEGGNEVPDVSCANSLDCVDTPGERSICDPEYRVCVECVTAADCAENHDCIAENCVEFTPCKNSLDCPLEEVCDTATEHCVDCVTTADCADDEVCVLSECRPACTSDRQCTPLGLLCNPNEGHCAECYRDADCPDAEYCDRGVCRADRCEEDRAQCLDGAVVVCSESGSGFASTTPCAERETCVEEQDTASCAPWACTAGETECGSLTELVTCSDDGLSVVSRIDCSDDDQSCVQGACSDLACPPSEPFCASNEVRQCDAEGLAWSVVTACGTEQYCDNGSPSCKPRVCTPDEPGCNDNSVATCNEDGSGFVSVGTPCGDRICVEGTCMDLACAPNEPFCSGMEVRRCAEDGLSSTVTTTCTAAQYCDSSSDSCKARVCTPGTMGCSGNAVATCNATGSGFESPGTSCGAQRCAGGACVDALLTDDFEDGDYEGWTLSGAIPVVSSVSAEVVTTSAADGSARSLAVTGQSLLVGVFSVAAVHSISANPLGASFWGRVANTTSACTLGFGSSLAVGFGSGGTFAGMGASPAAYVADRWYHFEIRDVDWTAGTYSVYVDGTLRGSNITFTPPSSGQVTSIRLNVTPQAGGTTVCLWDEIVVR